MTAGKHRHTAEDASGSAKRGPAFTYTIGTMQRVLGTSRDGLRYYERVGLLDPVRDEESSYRLYSDADVYRVVNYLMLKNADFDPQGARDAMARTSEPADFLAACAAENERNLLWHQTLGDRLCHLQEAPFDGSPSAPRLVHDETWSLYRDLCENGYSSISENDVLDALLPGMPVSSFAAIYEGSFFEIGQERPRWGRAIPTQFASFFPGLATAPEAPELVGEGMAVAVQRFVAADIRGGWDRDYAVRGLVKDYMVRHRLVQRAPAFVINCLPFHGSFHVELRVPVRKAGLAASIAAFVEKRSATS